MHTHECVATAVRVHIFIHALQNIAYLFCITAYICIPVQALQEQACACMNMHCCKHIWTCLHACTANTYQMGAQQAHPSRDRTKSAAQPAGWLPLTDKMHGTVSGTAGWITAAH